MCGGGFKESQTNTIDFSSEVQAFIEAMLLFLYQGDYPDIDVASVEDESQDFENFRIEPNDDATIQDQSHKDQPEESLSTAPHLGDSDSNPSEVDEEAQAQYCYVALHKLSYHIQVYAMGDRFDIPPLQDLAKRKYHHVLMPLLIQELLLPFLETVPLIYNTTHENNRALRDVALVHIMQRKDEISEEAVLKAEFLKTVTSTPQFASDLLLREWSASGNACEICDEECEKE